MTKYATINKEKFIVKMEKNQIYRELIMTAFF